MRALGLLIIGLLLGLYGAVVQAMRLHVGSLTIPVGLVISLACLVPVARAGAWWVRGRWGAMVVGLSWLGATLALASRTPWGDLLLDNGQRQMVYLVGGAALLAGAATFPLLPGGRERRSRASATAGLVRSQHAPGQPVSEQAAGRLESEQHPGQPVSQQAAGQAVAQRATPDEQLRATALHDAPAADEGNPPSPAPADG